MTSGSEPRATFRLSEPLIVALVLVLVVGMHALVFGRYLPNSGGRIGHDYAYFFPNLLAGANWFHENGPLSIPWFTPAFGGGLPFYAHPASTYVSFPQLAAITGGAIFAVRATLVVFAALGFIGAYLCTRRTFALSLAASLFCATLFAWNGFFTARMLAGHLGFHSQMLVPLAAWCVTRPVAEELRAQRIAFDAVCVGLLFAYMFQSGNFYGLVPAALSCAAIGILASWRGARISDAMWRMSAGTLVAILLCAAKLSAASAFVNACPRTGYPLPGASNIFGAVLLALQSVFLFPWVDLGRFVLQNERWRLDLHEWDFRLTWVALALIVAAAFTTRREWRVRLRGRRNLAFAAALTLVLVVPIAVNVYSPVWTAFLKRVPLVQSSSNLVRWFVAYVPVFAVIAAIAVEKLALAPRKRVQLVLAASLALFVTRALEDRTFYETQLYDSTRIESALRALRDTGRVTPIDRVGAPLAPPGAIMPVDRNDGLADGMSPIACYEPIFGYGLEWFPIGALHPGPAREVHDGTYNFKNPASYVFPSENGVQPGDHVKLGEERALDALLAYHPMPFIRSERQKAAEIVNLAALAATILFFVGVALSRTESGTEPTDVLARPTSIT